MDKGSGDSRVLLRRIKGEYLEMPGLRLTAVQAQRLWQLDAVACQTLLDSLVQSKFLCRSAQGAYVRRTSDSDRASVGRHSEAEPDRALRTKRHGTREP